MSKESSLSGGCLGLETIAVRVEGPGGFVRKTYHLRLYETLRSIRADQAFVRGAAGLEFSIALRRKNKEGQIIDLDKTAAQLGLVNNDVIYVDCLSR